MILTNDKVKDNDIRASSKEIEEKYSAFICELEIVKNGIKI
jgi:hypothetical protein